MKRNYEQYNDAIDNAIDSMNATIIEKVIKPQVYYLFLTIPIDKLKGNPYQTGFILKWVSLSRARATGTPHLLELNPVSVARTN